MPEDFGTSPDTDNDIVPEKRGKMPKFSFKRPSWKWILIGIGGFFAFGVAALAGIWLWAMQGLPSADQLANYEPPITSRIHAGDGRLVAEFANQHRVYVPSEEIPPQLIYAFISAE